MIRQLCTFHVGGGFFAVDATRVQEVIREQPMTRVPLAPPVISGLINLRGQIITALDLRHRLHLAPRGPEESPMNVVVRSSTGTLSLLVDDVGEVVQVPDEQRERVPETVKPELRDLVEGVFQLEGALLLELGPDRVANLDPAEATGAPS